VLKKRLVEQLADGTPTNGLPYDRAGSDIDTTNPDAAKWYWETIATTTSARASTRSGPMRPSRTCRRTGSYFHVGPGTQFFNVYPLFHTAAFYDGMRRD
jgi:alpha-D-xyloside xylohydrolase